MQNILKIIEWIRDAAAEKIERDYNKSQSHKHKNYLKITANFPTMYLTVISVIQAAAFGGFMFGLHLRGAGMIPQNPLEGIVYILTLLVIIVIWFEYVIAALAFVWIPRIWDSIIPFFKGAIEYGFIYYCIELVKSPETSFIWLAWFSALCGHSIWAYRNMYSQARKLIKENELTFNALEKKEGHINLVNFTYYFLTFVTFICAIAFIYSWQYQITSDLNFLYSMAVLLFVLLYAIRGWRYWRRITEYAIEKPT